MERASAAVEPEQQAAGRRRRPRWGRGRGPRTGPALLIVAALLLIAGAYPPPPRPSDETPFPLDEPPPTLGAREPDVGTVSLYVDGDPVDVSLTASPVVLSGAPHVESDPVDVSLTASPVALSGTLDPDGCDFDADVLAERALLATNTDGLSYLLVSPLPLDQDTMVVSADAPLVRVCAATFGAGSTAALRLDEVILLDARRVDAEGRVSTSGDVGTGTPAGRTTLSVAAWLPDGTTAHFYAPVFVLASEDAPSGGFADRWWIPVVLAVLVLAVLAFRRRRGGVDAGE